MNEYREIIVKEYHNEKGLITRREIGEELVRCKDCKYRPIKHDPNGGEGFNLEPPTKESWSCPCLNEDDGWYSWMPDDDFYCSYGERKETERMKSEAVIKYRFAAKGDKEIEKKYDVESGTVWHVINKSGEKYSVIIDADGLEAMSMPREREQEMVDAWTEMVRNG